ncbi:MAG TPA: undecaprenyl-diphosphate phosphatase [Gemmatimonadales bacterium]|nr:undecaprenyl-diphosphate phosphatase [Gemmatimonadales bacterium]
MTEALAALPLWVKAILLGVVEGITEFLPVSSTGHLILGGHLLGWTDARAETFEIFIQLGAILAILWLYRARLAAVTRHVASSRAEQRFVLSLVIAFTPAAVAGFLFHHQIKAVLFTPVVVAVALVAGGVVILVIERWAPPSDNDDPFAVPPRTALGVGLAQGLALIPGVSRSGATILGGFSLGLTRRAATEFSFFLAIPVMFAATLFDLYSSRDLLTAADVPILAIGFGVSFIAALVVVRSFLRYVSHRSFAIFAWYRIAFGLLLLWVLRP